MHDLGKFAESFQNLRRQILYKLQSKVSKRKYAIKHDTLGWMLWKQDLREKMAGRGLIAVAEGSARRRQADIPFDCWNVPRTRGAEPHSEQFETQKFWHFVLAAEEVKKA